MRVLRVRGFALLLLGQAVSETGNWIAVIAIWGFASFRFDVGAGDLALLFVVLSVPGALLGPLLGVPIDRLGPRRTLLIANLLGVVDALALSRADSYTTITARAAARSDRGARHRRSTPSRRGWCPARSW
jgi:nitrate/nitrite transporter NarK